jgi:hypothetical protein
VRMPMLTENPRSAGLQQVSGILGILGTGSISPSLAGCEIVGFAPFCAASASDCYAMNKRYCGPATNQNCITGTKVLCCDSCP